FQACPTFHTPFRWNQIWLLNITPVNREYGGIIRCEIRAAADFRGGFFVLDKLSFPFFGELPYVLSRKL
ncbi:hypothetical protein NSR32_24270, partial [Salmonella enterica]|nr:hypothetical protein [Salmonella enterica]